MTSIAIDLPEAEREEFLRKLRERARAWFLMFHRHDLLMARAVRGAQSEVAAEFERAIVAPLLREIAGRLSTIRTSTGAIAAQLLPEVIALRDAIDHTVAIGATAVRDLTEKKVDQLAAAEAEWVTQSAGKAAGLRAPVAPAVPPIRTQAWLGDTTEKWFEKLLVKPAADAARGWVTTGIQQGLTVDEITRGLVGTRTQKGILDAPRAAARALVRTASTAAAATSRQESFKSLGVTHWRFVATLDQRTSIICASEDGNIYPVGEGPIPPLHPNCRSVPSPVIGQGEPVGTRASINGHVPASTTFEEWLGSIPKGEQNDILGVAKASAWRAGKVSLKDLLGRDLQPLTLAELRRLDRI